MNIAPNDFILLGMNLGANQRDYAMLHGNVKLSNDDQLSNYINNCHELTTEKVEKLFALLEAGEEITFNPKNQAFALLILNQGLDILELHIKKNENFQKLIEHHFEMFLNKFIENHFSLSNFKNLYPDTYAFLTSKESLDSLLKEKFLCVEHSIELNEKPAKMNDLTPLQNQLQTLKDRLSANFFHQVVFSSPKPAVIALQEVQASNQGVLDQLIASDYQIFRYSAKSDLAIAIDTGRMQNPQPYYCNDDFAAVYVDDKITKEGFIFLTAHIPGYKLEIPTEPEKMEEYLKTVEGSLESGAFQEVIKLTQFISELKACYPHANIMIEGDFNTYPEYFTDNALNDRIKKMDVFSYLCKHNGLNIFRTNRATELNQFAESLKLRELDYVFASDLLKKRVKVFEPENEELALVTRSEENNKMNFNPTLLFSDHSPIWVYVAAPQTKWGIIKNFIFSQK